MTHRGIRELIAARLQGIANIGQVHAYERWSKRVERLRELYAIPAGNEQQIRGWFVRRVAPSGPSWSSLCDTRSDTWQIRGFMSLSDTGESELDFDDLVDAVMNDFFQLPSLGGTARLAGNGSTPAVRLTRSEPVMFAGVLCHSAIIEITTLA